MTPRIAYQSHPKAYFSNFHETFILNNPRMVLHRFHASGDQTIHAKAAKKPPQKKYNKSSKKNQPPYHFFHEKLRNRRSKCTPKVLQNPYKSSPGPPWDSKVAQAIPESCPKAKNVCSGHENGPRFFKKIAMRASQMFLRMQKKTRRASKGGIASESSSKHRGSG
jgi:hypothetical protein